MASCELCGKDDFLSTVLIEDAPLSVCQQCSRYGKEKIPIAKNHLRKIPFISAKPELKLGDNFSEIIRSKRESMGLTRAEFSTYLNERESIVSKWQSGLMKPSLELAKKLERKLGLTLLETEPELSLAKTAYGAKMGEGLTLGDFIKKKVKIN